ncbi:hypothetical protein A5855_002360, partial [Enterococcus faecium]
IYIPNLEILSFLKLIRHIVKR